MGGLVEGAEPTALQQAVAARAGCASNDFFLTTSARDEMVIPLSSVLPDGTELTLHLTTRPIEIAQGHSPERHDSRALGENNRSGAPNRSDLSSHVVKFSEDRGHSQAGERGKGPSLSEPLLEEVVFSLPSDRQGEKDTYSSDKELQTEMLTSMERFGRLTTYLANERTLLAWVRTCLAATRTAFSFLGVSGTSAFWSVFVFLTQCTMLTLVLVLCGSGYLRYSAIKHAINTKLPPEKFGRLTVKYMYSVLSVASVAIAMGMYTKHYVRA